MIIYRLDQINIPKVVAAMLPLVATQSQHCFNLGCPTNCMLQYM